MSNSTLTQIDWPQAGVIRLTLSRPDALNALSSEMMSELQDRLKQIAMDPQCRVLVIAAEGKAFCAGHDLREMRAQPDLAFYQSLFTQCSRLMQALQQLPQPVIAQVQGIATAAGCQLVSMCDLAVASDRARFAVSGINYGLFCSTPSVGLSRNVARKKAMEMLLTGDFIDAAQAEREGLINRCVPAEQLDLAVAELCQKIVAKPPASVRMGKALFYQQLELGIAAAYQLAGQTMACNMMDHAAQEGFQAFLEKRPPQWPAP
ncbi:MAG: enoyl-CoA hydratase [Alphaproteobacteria bacterium]|nr:enoyl-CoA hydratase [Alphaproteobacteria bacterium]